MKRKVAATAAALSLTLTVSAGVYAASNLQEIKALLNNKIGIVVNGQAYTPKDGNGKTLAPITYNGITYLPVRSIGEALNTAVTYDASTSRVIIGDAAAPAVSSGGSSTGTPADSVKRPKSLPADFPLPADAKIFDLIEGSATGKPSATFSYRTKQSLETLGNTYKDYFVQKELPPSLRKSPPQPSRLLMPEAHSLLRWMALPERAAIRASMWFK